MREIFIAKLAEEKTWKGIFTALGIIATGSVSFIDPKIAGFIGIGFIALISPMGKLIAKTVCSLTNNYAATPSTLDDILHAAAEAVVDIGAPKIDDTTATKK